MINPELVHLIESWIYSPLTDEEREVMNIFIKKWERSGGERERIGDLAVGFLAGYNEAMEKKEGKK